jgi:hypothetical protein
VVLPSARSASSFSASRCAVQVACSTRLLVAATAQGGDGGLQPLSPPRTALRAHAAASAARVRSGMSSRSFCAMAP